MNDFTKAELIEMRESVLIINMQMGNYDFTLIEKLRSLIDNYCEHEVIKDKDTWAVVKDYERKSGEIEIVFGKADDIWSMYADAESITYFETQQECEQYRDKLINE